MTTELNRYLSCINHDQMLIFSEIINFVDKNQGGLFFLFVYGYGNTGKTFVWKTLYAVVRVQGKIVLNVTSSGIVSLLLSGGTFKVKLLQHTSVIIWDEAPVINKWAFEVLDRTLRDIMRFKNMNAAEVPFGGKIVVLGGDFRQILSIIPKTTREDIVLATINSSKLCTRCKVLHLTKSMMLQSDSNFIDESNEEFADWIIRIGGGNVGIDEDCVAEVDIPEDLLLLESKKSLYGIIDSTYPNLLENMNNFEFFEERAILAPTLEVVQMVNEYVLSSLLDEEKEYLSSDSYFISDENVGIESKWLTLEFSNKIKCFGILNHKLVLKKGVHVMLLKNIDQFAEWCNGTRLIVEEMRNNIIGARIIIGSHKGEKKPTSQ